MLFRVFRALFKFLKNLLKKFASILIRSENPRIISFASGTISFSDCVLALSLVFRRKYLRQGRFIKKFEEAFADCVGAKYAYSSFKGRVSLSTILYALEFKPGDEIILPGYTCVVVPNALIYRGLKPVYVDIDPNTFNINPDDFERKITERTKGVILQYTYGLIPDLARLLSIARKYDLKVIEDCAHALGAEYKGRKVGSFGDAAFFSMEQTKVISTGVGGMAVTDNPRVAEKLKEFQRKCSFPECGEIQLWLLELIFQYLHSHPSHGWWLRELIRVTSWRLRSKLPVSTTNAECQGIKPESYEKRMPNALARIGV